MIPLFRRGWLPALVLLLPILHSPAARAQDDSEKAALSKAWNEGLAFSERGKYQEAIAEFEKALALAPRVYGDDHYETAALMYNLAIMYRNVDQYAKAEPLFLKSLKIREDKYGLDHPDLIRVLDSLGLLYWKMGQYARSEPHYQRSLKIREARFGSDHQEIVPCLNNLAIVYRDMGQYAKAEPLFQRSLKILETKLGPDHADLVAILDTMGLLYWKMRQYAKAEHHYERSLKIQEARFGSDHQEIAPCLNNLAIVYQDMGQYAKAEPLFQRSLKILETKLGPDHADVAESLKNLGLLYWKMGQYAKAEHHYERSLKIQEARFGSDHQEIVPCLNNLAIVYRDMGLYSKVELLFQRSLKILETKLGPDHADVVNSLNSLALLYQRMCLYSKAEPLFQRCLKIREAQLGPDHADVARSLNSLALLYWKMGQYSKAEPLFQRCLKIREAQLGPDHADVAESLNNLANLYQNMGQYARAESLYQRGLKIKEAKLGPDHSSVATNLNDLAELYRNLGQYARAEPLYLRSLKIREVKYGPDDEVVSVSLNNLANMYTSLGQYVKAEPLYLRSLKIVESKLGPDHPAVAHRLNNLAELYRTMGQYAKTEPLLKRSLMIREAKLGPDHPDVAQSLNNLAELYRTMGQYAKTEPLLKRSLMIREAKLGPDHPAVAQSLNNLIFSNAFLKRWPEATAITDRSRHGVRRHVAHVLPILSENEQLSYLQRNDESRFHRAQSFGLAQHDDPTTVALSAGWVINGKAVAQQALTERALLARETKDPALAPLSKELANVRRQLATLALADYQPDQAEEHRRQIASLNEREQELSKKLGQAGGHTTRDDPWIELEEVCKVLPADAVLIEISKFKVFNFEATAEKKNWWLGDRYAAWLIFPAEKASRERERPEFSSVRLIDLGPAGKIEDAVKAVRLELQKAQSRDVKKNPILLNGEEEAEEALRQLMIPLAKLVLEPLMEHIGAKKQWIISPDAALWLVPWAALPLKDVKYAVEKYQISYVISGRDLVTPPAKVKPGRSMIVADPDYDLGLADARVAARKLLDAPEGVEELRGLTSASALPLVERLPGTAREAAAVKPKLEQLAKDEVWVYKDKNAQEAVFKSFKSPRILVLCTHGFFLEDQEVAESARSALRSEDSASRLNGASKSALLTKDGKLFENPLVRCGLLLAGCNDREGGRKETDEDGVLTGLEIVGTDLRGTELVVLSACETGLGQVRNGEGVAGLRQAFQLAGARAVVATLWQVPDNSSALLMGDFFENLAAGKSKAEALRAAQLARIKARRQRDGAAHPFFWAAFTLTGE